jgi:transcriptional regulator with XRE-family HTH domain
MYSSQQQISSPEVFELRKEAGLWLKELREKRGLSQRQMAEKVGGELLHLHLSIGVRARPDTPRSIFGVGRGFGRGAEAFRQKSPKEL